MKRLLVIEDGTEYEEFCRLFLAENFAIEAAHSLAEARAALSGNDFSALLIDLHFSRTPAHRLVGDVDALATRLFFGNQVRALAYVREEQGVLILSALRSEGHEQRALFVHEFGGRRLANLQALYRDVLSVATFDAERIQTLLCSSEPTASTSEPA